MKLKMFDKILLMILLVTLGASYLLLNSLTIFQYMFFIMLLPSIILALVGGRLAAKSRYVWIIIIFITSVIYTLEMYGFTIITNMDLIESNTVQSKTSVFTFNRHIDNSMYVGLFIQQFIITAFVMVIGKVLLKIKNNKF